jgi:hypothetical protein
VPGASVTLKNQDTGEIRTTMSDAVGTYSLLSIQPGTYAVTVPHEGFQTVEVTDRVAKVGAPAFVDVKLVVGQTSQTITVSAAGADLIDPSSAEVSGAFSQNIVSLQNC